MLDLIIPVYNNRKGLCRTLASIGIDINQSIFITLVDDASTESYDDIIEMFSKFFPIRIFRLEQNCGPGIARQYGLDQATQEFISFIDCGDTFVCPDMLATMLNTIDEFPDNDAYFWAHTEERNNSIEIMGSQHNRMHGKIYRRQFLLDNNITFSTVSPRANEDIGFNMAIRIIDRNNAYKLGQHQGRIWCSEEPAVNWVSIDPSIVRANNNAYYYKEQNMGLALNMEHAFNIAGDIIEKILIEEVYIGMAHEYYFYMATKSCRPEFLSEAYEGALYFYKNLFRKYKHSDSLLLRTTYYKILSEHLSDIWDPIHEDLLPLDYKGFLDELEEQCKQMDIELAKENIKNKN